MADKSLKDINTELIRTIEQIESDLLEFDLLNKVIRYQVEQLTKASQLTIFDCLC